MKTLASVFFLVCAANATLITSVTCTATVDHPIVSVTDPTSCNITDVSPGGPLTAYRAEASYSSPGEIRTHVYSGGWIEDRANPILIYPIVTAKASATFTDTVVFAGTGPATLRVTLALRALSIDNTGSFRYTVNGVSQNASFDPRFPTLGHFFSERDYQITLGVPTSLGYFATTESIAGHGNSDSSGIAFSVAGMRVLPVSEIPEPSTLVLLGGSLLVLCWRRGAKG